MVLVNYVLQSDPHHIIYVPHICHLDIKTEQHDYHIFYS